MDRKQEFMAAVKLYDYSYEMSDDHRCWVAGREEQHRLRQQAAAIDEEFGEGTSRILWKEAMDSIGRDARYMTSTGAES